MELTLKTAVEQFETKNSKLNALLALEGGVSDEQYVEINQLDGDLKSLESTIKGIRAKESAAAAATGREAFLNDPAPEYQGSTDLITPGGMVKGYWTPAGETHIEHVKRKNALHYSQIGAGVISQKTYNAISKPEYKEAFGAYLRKGKADMSAAQFKLLQEGVDDQGGFTLPEDWLNRVLMKKPTPTRVQNFVQAFNTVRDSLTIPTSNYQTATDDPNGILYPTGIRASFTGEVPATSTTARVADSGMFGQKKIPVYTCMMSIPVTNDLLEDSGVDIFGWLEDRFAETIQLLYDNMILNGKGVNQPGGIFMNPGGTWQPAVVNSGDPSHLTADGLQSLAWSVPEQYEDDCRFVFNKTNTGQAIAKLKDGEGRYLWGYGLNDSGLRVPLKDKDLLGYPVSFSGFAPNVGANNYPIAFGDFQGYALARRIGFSIQVLREVYAEVNQILLLGRVRFGGEVAEPWRLYVQKVSS